MAKSQKRSKYKAVRCEVDGEKFDSQKEARRWSELLLLQKAAVIRGLLRQIQYPLFALSMDADIDRVCIGHYVGDFEYYDLRLQRLVIEDCKGVRTPLYRWKKKHFEAQYGRKILET